MSTMNKKLAGENLIEFINFYREQECLWNIYSKNYKNIFLKNKAYNLMAKKFKIGPQEVKTKINNLRSNFNREFKKCEDSKRSGAGVEDIYVPQIYWYDEMLFLKDCITPRASVSNIELDFSDNDSVTCSPATTHENEPPRPSISRERKHQYEPKNTRLDDALKNLKEICEKSVDEIDEFCKNLAAQLKTLPKIDVYELMAMFQNELSQRKIEKERGKQDIINLAFSEAIM